MSANDKQVSGTHYQKPIQVWDFIHRNNIGYLEGNVIKYISRYQQKNGLEDLEKAQHYLTKIIEEYKEQEEAQKLKSLCNPYLYLEE